MNKKGKSGHRSHQQRNRMHQRGRRKNKEMGQERKKKKKRFQVQRVRGFDTFYQLPS